jgi:group II intron reverse transcriptase/maturase
VIEEPKEVKMSRAQDLGSISTRLRRIANLARERPQTAFTSLAHNIDEFFLREAYARTRKDGASGVDGQTAADYEKDLSENLRSLLSRFKSGQYHAPPVLRKHIPKGPGKTRPIGIPTLEDKVLQRAVLMVMEAVYEQDFLDCSYGFRPRRSAQEALRSLREGLLKMRGGWVLDADIQSFYDDLDKSCLRSFLDQRVRDGVLRRTIHKWLKAGVMESGEVHYPEKGTPQGGVISPLLANVYLHEVLDTWFETEVKPRLRGQAFLVRFADDFVIVFSHESDARRVLEVLPKRLERFGLRIHPEKTSLVEFQRPPWGAGRNQGAGPGTFDLLGFTHYWSRSRKGNWVVKRKTASSRLSRALREINQWCRENRHAPVSWQHEKLSQKLHGHWGYYGVSGNFRAVCAFRWKVGRIWKYWLGERSQRRMTWAKFQNLVQRYPLPRARVCWS